MGVGGIAAIACTLVAAVGGLGGSAIAAAVGGASAVLSIAVILLARRFGPDLDRLRFLEALLFAALLAATAAHGLAAPGAGDWLRTELHLSLVLGAYGVLIPTSAKRAIAVLSLMAVVAAAIVLAVAHRAGAPLGEAARGLPWLAIATLLAMAAATLIALFRDVAIETRIINMYDLGEQIGAGGMGEVWRARHQRLARPAAIKIIRPDQLKGTRDARAAARALFEREARSTAQLRSPHTIQVYDFGITSNETFYYVMEFLEGYDLDTLVKIYGPVPAARCIFLLRQACASLADAHASGLVHRDIKPANLFVSRLGLSFDHLKLLDFGLAMPVDSENDPTSIDGTATTIAPETVTGEGAIDPRSDLYSLGCVAYFMLTGQRVFDANTFVKMAAAHVMQTPVRPSLRGAPDIPAELDDIVMKCLAKVAGDRFATARELDAALAAVATPPWTQREAEAWWQANAPRPLADEPQGAET